MLEGDAEMLRESVSERKGEGEVMSLASGFAGICEITRGKARVKGVGGMCVWEKGGERWEGLG